MKYGQSYQSLANELQPYLMPRTAQIYAPSGYPASWNKTITIVNDFENQTTFEHSKILTVLDNCFVQTDALKETSTQTISNVLSTILRIPKNSRYKKYKDWISNHNGYFTLHQGDLILIGEFTTWNDSYLTSEEYYSIKSFTDNSDSSRCMAHYKVIGI